ncbi:hypothetical protein [Kitasatospora cheerisanensis]|uniref:Uncharacterized protein n=1 Tax=Kitasatospora cheerisanensis KCTC 2395 TaxID=1348663 RepID=A0A066ZCH3_9ACTN|nr:hypothetical protein [Kitasatospora cheerisanensis]KDN88021.1 hypothetical protein KCH_02450 [Kitasatospora cheerisanensis KCTC 2395]
MTLPVSPSADQAAGPAPDPTSDVYSADGGPGAGSTGQQLPPQQQMAGWAVLLLGVLLLAEAFACVAALISVWTPLTTLTAERAQVSEPMPWSVLGLGPWHLTSNTAMLVAVLAASGLGSFVHAATSFATYAGNRQLLPSWLPWYLLRTAIGGALALLVYFLLRGGLFANGTDGTATNPYGFAGIAGLCGLFSKQATDKLREIFDTVLTTRDGAGDDERDDKIQPTAPTSPSGPAATPAPATPAPSAPSGPSGPTVPVGEEQGEAAPAPVASLTKPQAAELAVATIPQQNAATSESA